METPRWTSYPQAPEATYAEDVEANGQARLGFAAPVPGLLEQGHEHTAGFQGLPPLLRPPNRQQELWIFPKCVWEKHSKVRIGLWFCWHPSSQTTERCTVRGHLHQAARLRSIWTEWRPSILNSMSRSPPALPPQVLLHTPAQSCSYAVAPLPSKAWPRHHAL